MKLLPLAIKTLTLFLFFCSWIAIIYKPVLIAWYSFWGLITMILVVDLDKGDAKWGFINGWVWKILAIAYYLVK